jgi:pimeloyl-ACP methyl ester carboxylesterase
MNKPFSIVFIALLAFSACLEKKATAPSHYDEMTSIQLPGSNISVFKGTLPVIENRKTGKGRTIDINFIVIPAIKKGSRLSPLFYIEGGPGAAASASVGFFADSANPYRQDRDIVLIDARGTGNSNPLHCLSTQEKNNLQEQFDEMYPETAVIQCRDSLSKFADLTQYTTPNIIKDFEEVRKWLGYEKVSLMGLSYGTRASLVYMRMFPESIDKVVLISAVTTYAHMPQYHAAFAQQSLNMVFDDCAKDPACSKAFPNLKTEFEQLREKFPFSYQLYDDNGKITNISIPWYAFHTKLRSMLYSPGSIRRVPYLIHQTWLGKIETFADLFPKRKDTDLFIADGLYLCVTCAEDVPYIEDDKINSLTTGTFLGTYRIEQQRRACKLWPRGEIPDDYLKPVKSSIPTLILSGSFDPVTPTSMAKEIASTLSNSKLIIIPDMAHSFEGLENESCADKIMLDFLNGVKNINTECITTMKRGTYKTN